jgi:hypothetical protein
VADRQHVHQSRTLRIYGCFVKHEERRETGALRWYRHVHGWLLPIFGFPIIAPAAAGVAVGVNVRLAFATNFRDGFDTRFTCKSTAHITTLGAPRTRGQ